MIKIKLTHYNFDSANEEYFKLREKIKSLGHKEPFAALCDPGESSFQDETATVETDYLFENQFNTKEGHRLFDWKEPSVYIGGVRSRRRWGYFISEGLEALNEARRNQYACGYCGKRYENLRKKSDQDFCDSCIDSPYLTQDMLYMLYLVPVIYDLNEAHKIRKECAKKIPFSWSQIENKQEIARRERLKREAAKMLEDLKRERLVKDYEYSVKIALLESGIEVGNLIFYSHTGEWCFGWRDPVTSSQKEAFQQVVDLVKEKIPVDKDGIEFLNLVKYKLTGETIHVKKTS